MKAMVLAAGKGTRIRPVTDGTIPKPMVDVGAGPLLEHTINHLIDHGVEEIVINLHHRGTVIQDYFGERWRGVPLTYVEEDDLLGTAGAVRNAQEHFDETFILVYGDVLTDIDLERLSAFHAERDALLTMLVYREEENLEEASIVLTDENRVTEMIEKPSPAQVAQYRDEAWTNAGVFIMEPSVIDRIPTGFADFGKDVLPDCIAETGRVYAYPLPEDAYWHEVGTPERYEQAVEDVASGTVRFSGR